MIKKTGIKTGQRSFLCSIFRISINNVAGYIFKSQESCFMGLKLKELQKVVVNVVKKEKSYEILREEITRVLGPTVLTTRGVNRMAESANDILDICEATGKSIAQIKPSLLVKFVNSEHVQVRKLISRLLPENFLKLMSNDPDSTVRFSVAKRLPKSLVVEMMRKFPNDEALRTIANQKVLNEQGIAKPKIIDEPFDLYGEEPLKASEEDLQHPGLTDTWYQNQAHKIFNMFGRNIEQQWEESTVRRYVDSMKSMGIEVDLDKLLDAVYDLIEARQEEVMKEGLLSSLANNLKLEGTGFMPVISEQVDNTTKLVSSRYSSSEYIQRFENLFKVKHAISSNPSYKILREGAAKVKHPSTAMLPSSTYRSVDEKALDMYVNAWNSKESFGKKAHYKLAWSPDAEVVNMVNFHLELK
jgi:hypothetical protein